MNKIIISCLVLLLFSCGSNESAKNDLGDLNNFIEHKEKKQKKSTNNQGGNTQKDFSSNEEVQVSIENVISEGGASMEFSNTVWDFGQINQGESVDHVFTFINTGNEPLIISNAKGSCGCTVPEWPKEPIPPNGTGEIAVEFNSGEKKGRQNKTVTLTTNCTPNTTILRVVGNILTN